MTLAFVDYLILVLYFAFVIGIGWLLKKKVSTAEEFLTSGRSLPVWITSLAFVATNLGAQELIGMCASGAKYGIMTAHFYWVGAIPAMLFVGLFMMPFYYGSRARSVPEYLKLRYDEKTRTFNAITFAVMTVFSSGISMYALGRLFELMLGWSFATSVLVSAVIVLCYTYLGGLTSAIYNEVLQFFLIVLGFSPLAIMAISKAGGWHGIQQRLSPGMTHAWANITHSSQNPMGIELFGMVAGLGFVLSFGYWCTNFLVVQRAMAADSMSAARRTPLVGAFPKMFLPMIVILPGLAAAALVASGVGPDLLGPDGKDYNQAMNRLVAAFYPSGMLGVGLTALMASFMSGMAGNVTAFNTVWTYDIYQTHIRPNAPDSHYLTVGRISTIVGTLLSVGCAYVATYYDNIMDLLQLVFGFVNAPLFATFLLGMFWKRSTGHGAFAGLLSGTTSACLVMGLTVAEGKGGWLGSTLHTFPSAMAQNFWLSIIAWTVCFMVTILVSMMTAPKPVSELVNLVWGETNIPKEPAEKVWYRNPWI
ncbi:MAG TPA: sodium:solute symporter family protein, partial [Bryobacteraceae bacterium]